MGRQTHHTKAGLPVCCEQALKSVGEQNTHATGGVGAGTFGKPPARGALYGIDGGDLAAGPPCWEIADRKHRLALRAAGTIKAPRAPGGPTPQYKILYYCIIHTQWVIQHPDGPAFDDGAENPPSHAPAPAAPIALIFDPLNE
jgi:hypothetical protein